METQMSPTGKVPKSEVNYRPAEAMQSCAGCANFIKPSGCSKVDGRIEPNQLCDLFQEPVSEDSLMEYMF